MPMPSSSFRGMDRKKLVRAILEALKDEQPVQEALKKHGLDESVINRVDITFAPLDVSAKTVDGKVILNEKLLDEGWRDIIRYACHEIIHVFQQLTSDVSNNDNVDYLSNPQEVEAFKAQIDYMDEAYDPEEVQSYLEHLMDHHDIKGKERQRKIEELAK